MKRHTAPAVSSGCALARCQRSRRRITRSARGEAAGDVAEGHGLLEDEVARQVVVHLRGVGLHRLHRVGQHRQRCIVHVDQGGRVLGGVAIDRGDRRHRLARVPDLLDRQRVLHHRLGAEGGQGIGQLLGILAGDHREDAGQRASPARVDADDARMGVRAAEHRRVCHARQPHVVGVGGAPHQQARIFQSRDVLADPGALGRGHGLLLQRAAAAGVPATAPRSAASWTASTMPW